MRNKLFVILFAAGLAPVLLASDWTESRGPARDGTSSEKNLPSRWSPSGENLAWTLPFGGRSTPVIHGNRLYLQTTTTGDISTTQERLVAVDATSGRVLWDHKVSQFLSDVPQHRAAWASPAVDPASGNIFMFTVSAELLAFAPDGKVLWTRSLPEEYGAITTHGGRTTSPIVEGNMVILNTLLQGWGDLGRPGNRYFAFDKTTGQTVWISAPQSKHYDTNYSSPIVADVNGMRQLMVGGTDGVFYGIKANTGQPVWSLEVSKRAILNSPIFRDNTVYVAHGEENIDTTEMGMLAAVDATGAGVLTGAAIKWKTHNFMPTFASPVMDAERLYGVDNSAILGAFDLKTGKELWTKTLGTLQKGSPTLADGKLYIGTENGKFYILRPNATGVEVLDEDVLGKPGVPEPVIASPAVANGRVYVTSMDHVYAIGPKQPATGGATPAAAPPAAASGAPTTVQVFPYEALLNTGETRVFTVKLFDAKGQFIREAKAGEVQWATDQLAGTVGADGKYVAPADGAAGYVKATVGSLSGQARVRVIPPLPWSFDFEGIKAAPMWWTSNLKGVPRELDGSGVLARPRDDTVGRRTKLMMGRPDWSDYTVEADVRGLEMRRQRGDVGLINQRYVLMLFGNNQKLELQPWQAANEMTVSVPNVPWEVNTWYRMKLRVQNRADGTTLAQGKVWKRDEPEPAKWLIEKVDKIPHRSGAPGLYGDGISDVFFDNLKVYKNQ
ncbi:MAG TPA: PQQ-binding-like beta-propeller repeat protein [Vicinamibacterales bacterium]|nr:PQQ-binding-like beta-propeller repeat protein [Vicinamibacterales bacterium]